jgi:hypothetical protein
MQYYVIFAHPELRCGATVRRPGAESNCVLRYKEMADEEKRRFCSTGSHWTTGEFKKIGTVRWICMACYRRRKAELRNLPRNKMLATGQRPKSKTKA